MIHHTLSGIGAGVLFVIEQTQFRIKKHGEASSHNNDIPSTRYRPFRTRLRYDCFEMLQW